MSTQRKGLNSLRTLSGRVNQTFTPYRAYMQITCLKMEKSRRLQEQKARRSVSPGSMARLREIEAEKQSLQQALRRRGLKRRLQRAKPSRKERADRGKYTLPSR